jgi:hypothetical protein
MLRLRIRLVNWPRRALILTDTPRPNCSDCDGEGGRAYDYGDETGEYAGTEWDPCPCWNEQRQWAILPLPRRPYRRRHGQGDPWAANGYSDEPPF